MLHSFVDPYLICSAMRFTFLFVPVRENYEYEVFFSSKSLREAYYIC